MKKFNSIFILIILTIIFPQLAYAYALVLIVNGLFKRKYEVLSSIKENKYILMLIISSFIAIIFSEYLKISLFFGMMIFICLLTVSYVNAYCSRNEINKEQLLKVIYIVSLVTYTIGIIQMLDPNLVMPKKWIDSEEYEINKRMFSTFFNPNVFGFYINMIIITICVNMGKNNNKKFCMLEKVTFIASLVCLFFTFSRTSWISLILSLLCIGIAFDKKYIKYAVLISLFIFGIDILTGINRADISKISVDSSMYYRVELWKTSIRVIKDNIITGIGFGTFFKYTQLYSSVIVKYIEHCHNIYLQIFMETGLIGFTTFMVTLYSISKRLLKHYFYDKTNKYNMLVILMLCMTLIHGLVDSVSITPQIMLMMACFTGISMAEYRKFPIEVI